jgi:hypothetical protein
MDVQFSVYYNKLNTTGINITKVVMTYYLKGAGTSLAGGPLILTKGNNFGQVYMPAGNALIDYHRYYPYNPATVDSEGYSRVGTYTHSGPVWSPGRAFSLTKWSYFVGCASGDHLTIPRWQW